MDKEFVQSARQCGKTYEVTINDLYQDIKRLEKENAELRKRLEWQPMETAPQYNKTILVLPKRDAHPVVVQKRGAWWVVVVDEFCVYDRDGDDHVFNQLDLVGWKEVE